MGKKRGGKRHRSKGGPPGSEETEVAHAEEALEALEAGEEAEAQAAAQPSRRGDWLRKTEFGDYFERIKQLIEDCPFQGSLQFEAFVTSTVAEVLKRVRPQTPTQPRDRRLLLQRSTDSRQQLERSSSLSAHYPLASRCVVCPRASGFVSRL